jgi:5'-3' exonuclease
MIDENEHTNVSDVVQLSYVLPKESNHLLPAKIKKKLDLLNGYYEDDYDIHWSFCRYFWESHIELPYIDLYSLEELVNE